MKLLLWLCSLVLMCSIFKGAHSSVQTPLEDIPMVNTSIVSFSDAETGIVIAESSVNTVDLIFQGVHLFLTSKLLTTITSFLGPIGSIIGIVGGLLGIFNKGPDMADLFAEQTAFINESFIAMSNQVCY